MRSVFIGGVQSGGPLHAKAEQIGIILGVLIKHLGECLLAIFIK